MRHTPCIPSGYGADREVLKHLLSMENEGKGVVDIAFQNAATNYSLKFIHDALHSGKRIVTIITTTGNLLQVTDYQQSPPTTPLLVSSDDLLPQHVLTVVLSSISLGNK